MTFCLGIKLKDGLVGLADTRITSGTEVFLAKKVSNFQRNGHPMFLMTSGLRSVRDKALTYFEEELESGPGFDRLYKAANAFGAQLRRVAAEDGEALAAAGLHFNLHSLIGGRLSADSESKLYLVYPQGNWVEINEARPYHIIGESGYGRPVLDRSLKHTDSIPFAFKVGCLAFDSTRISASDVDFPLDVVIVRDGEDRVWEGRLQREDLASMSAWWSDRIRKGVSEIPQDWVDALVAKVAPPA
jgi:putative proteasome-type protease